MSAVLCSRLSGPFIEAEIRMVKREGGTIHAYRCLKGIDCFQALLLFTRGAYSRIKRAGMCQVDQVLQ